MSINRRHFVLAAGGASLAFVLGAGAYRVTRTPTTASLPWSPDQSSPEDVRLDAFRHAILAPNPHNRQPWLIRLEGADGAIVSCDLDRRLPETDPFDRQITIGFGCFLEIARIAAAERGHRLEVEDFPDGEPSPRLDGRPIARIRFVDDPSLAKDALFQSIRARRSTKEPYDLERPVAAELLDQLTAGTVDGTTVEATADAARLAEIRTLILDAGTIEATVPRTHLESVRLMRIGHQEIDASPDGIDLSGTMIEGLKLFGQISRDQLGDPESGAYKTGMEITREVYGSVPAALWIKTEQNRRRDHLDVGRAYVRANLTATALGLAMHPASQSLQEFPEMAEPFARAGRLFGAGVDERVQMLARVGYGPSVAPSPRWPLEAKLQVA